MTFLSLMPGRARVLGLRLLANSRAFRGALAPQRGAVEEILGPPRPATPRALSLEVAAVERPAPGHRLLRLRVPPPGKLPPYRPGQYLQLELELDGQRLRRAYSLCGDPADDHLVVVVRRVGRVSGWIHDHLRSGQRLSAQGPAGRFVLPRDTALWRRLVLIGAGVGATPLMAVARAAVADRGCRVRLLLGNSTRERILFFDELAGLTTDHGNLEVVHALTRPPPRWRGEEGRLEGPLLARLAPPDPRALYLVCGPPAMMQGVMAHLVAGGVSASRVRVERFVAPGARRQASGRVHSVRLARSGLELSVPDHLPVLQAAADAGLELAHSCTLGGCGACKVRVLSGELEMDEPNCLSTAERARGEGLICIGRPQGPLVIDA